MNDVERQLDEARTKLLDLTFKNPLLKFKPYKRSTAKVVDAVPNKVFKRLVLDEKYMVFLPKPESPEEIRATVMKEHLVEEKDNNGDLVRYRCQYCSLTFESGNNFDIKKVTGHLIKGHPGKVEVKKLKKLINSKEKLEIESKNRQLWESKETSKVPVKRTGKKYLQAGHTADDLRKRLFNIHKRAQTVMEEQGYNVLFLALGFLKWKRDPKENELCKAPLVLLPVELKRKAAKSDFRLYWNEEEITENISLQEILKEYSVKLPTLDGLSEKQDLIDYLNKVEKLIEHKPEWDVVTDIHLGFFKFTKFIMWKDLDADSWSDGNSPTEHPIIKQLFGDEENEGLEGFSHEEVDKKLSAEDVNHVKDADPYQIAAIEEVKKGNNLIIEGPPGTGKSQTIVNMIAELLAQGKKVLFASEKMAALEVVQKRLKEVGLEDFCLELHSRKARKTEMLKEIKKSIHENPSNVVNFERKLNRLDSLKEELNRYARAIREPFGEVARSPYELFSIYESSRLHFEGKDNRIPVINFKKTEAIKEKEWEEGVHVLESVAEFLPYVKPFNCNDWVGCYPDQVLPGDEEKYKATIETCYESVNHLLSQIEELSKKTGIKKPENIYEIEKSLTSAEIIFHSHQVNSDVLLNEEWNSQNEAAAKLIKTIKKFKKLKPKINEHFVSEAYTAEIETWLNNYEKYLFSFTRFFIPEYWELRKRVLGLFKEELPGDCTVSDKTKIIETLKELIEFQKLRREIDSQNDEGRALFGKYWKKEKSDVGELKEFSKWVVSFRQQLVDEVLEKKAVEIVNDGVNEEKVREAIDQCKKTAKEFEDNFKDLQEKLGLEIVEVFATKTKKTRLKKVAEKCGKWLDSIPKLQRWSQYVMYRQKVKETLAEPLIQLIEEDKLDKDDVLPDYRGSLSKQILRQVFKERPVLGEFMANAHEKKIDDFMNLDQEVIKLNRERLSSFLYKDRPSIASGASKGSEAGILLHEMNKKRRIMPIRKLMEGCGDLIQKLKPCFLMSPLSVAKFLSQNTNKFDVIIFDEASQIKPEDALGTILRGHQVVVLGDTKQLPPTDFFEHVGEDIDEPSEEYLKSVADIESILGLCKSCMPHKMLRWHYRSNHESLITVSNHEFYDNKLVFCPSPKSDDRYLGLHFKCFPETTYDRGGSRVNRKEARLIAQEALEHFKRYGFRKSLGIGTFSKAQRNAIWEEIELIRREHPEMDEFFSHDGEEHFFVKNLETIQGDERDVIYISIGYGYDQHRKLTMHFGPLNNKGGWRRLNVLITRAKDRCVVFSNFKAEHLRVKGSSARGVQALKTFLEYAETKNISSLSRPTGDFDSPFEKSVYNFLRENDYDVDIQVGTAGYRIDLAIVDPELPGNYLIGIECDGAQYHSSKVARERDRLRQQVLEDLGWNIHRVWSTNWFRERKETQERLIRSIEKLKSQSCRETNNKKRIFKESQSEVSRAETDKNVVEDENKEEVKSIKIDLSEKIQSYQRCNRIPWDFSTELRDVPVFRLSKVVNLVVKKEAPIHEDAVVFRIRDLAGYKRTGPAIKKAIKKAIARATKVHPLYKKDNFLFYNNPIQVRKRDHLHNFEIDWIAKEEIIEAFKMVLNYQFATPKDELIRKASRLFGYKSTSEQISGHMEKALKLAINKNTLTIDNKNVVHIN